MTPGSSDSDGRWVADALHPTSAHRSLEPPMATTSHDHGSQPPRKPRRWDVQVNPLELPVLRTPEAGDDLGPVPRKRRSGRSDNLGECLLYPLRDGPGVAMLVVMPTFLWVMSIPVFDVVAALAPKGGFNALALLILPFTLPLVSSFVLVLGYVFLFLGQVLVASALGEDDHPSWPEWDSHHILEGLARMFWAVIVGFAVGGFPAVYYWLHCGDIDLFDQIVFAELLALGAAYAQMALTASLLNESLLAANPVTVVRAIVRIGWRYLYPCLVTGIALVFTCGLLLWVLFRAPSPEVAALSLWASWVFALYEAMVLARLLGLTYYHNAHKLAWFRKRPRWSTSSRTGRIYA